MPAMSGARLRVAVLGAGTVGREVACALLERPAELRPADGAAPGAGRRRRPRRRAGAPSAACRPSSLTDAPAHLVADETIDVIVELMGGDEPAHTLIAAALSMGKRVVTANKHVIAHHGAGARGDRPPDRRARCGSRRRSAAGSRSSGRSPRTSPRTGSSASAASSTARPTTS